MTYATSAATRRKFLCITLSAAASLSVLPSSADATPETLAAELKKMFGDKKLLDGKIKLDLPSIAENGLVVPLGFDVQSPMTESDYVKAVHILAEGNPNPQVASFQFTPLSPKAAASIRIRLAQTQNIVGVAEMSNGELYITKREVKVTIGGCGG